MCKKSKVEPRALRNSQRGKKAQSSCCSAPGLPPVRQRSATMQPERVPKLQIFCVIYPVTWLWRVPGSAPAPAPAPFASPSLLSLSPSGASLLSRSPLSDGGEVGGWSHLWPERRGRFRGGGDVSGRASRVRGPSRCLQVERCRVGSRTRTSPKWLECVELQTVKLIPGNLSFFFFFFFSWKLTLRPLTEE